MGTAPAIQADRLDVPGGSLYYEVRGQGPVLLLMPGGPADATTFRPIEEALARDHTVVTYDPRGISHSSPFDTRDDDRMVEIFADDAGRLLAALSGGKASVFASSGGAVVALELVRTRSAQLETVVVHEPPSPDLLADAEGVRAANEDICDTCAREGIFPATQKFMALIGIQGGPPSPPEDQQSPQQVEAMAIAQKNLEFFFSRYIRNLSRYRIDAAALKSCSCRIVAAVGGESSGQLAHNGGLGLARLLGVPATVFPGDHGGFQGRPEEFATKLREVLGS